MFLRKIIATTGFVALMGTKHMRQIVVLLVNLFVF